ncbi:MAG: Maf family nucleotide pyrophosphatase [Bacteroidales bacterium]|nr:Maf family nucleotide pyrophosphatase [Bacteroidales bacterium]
MLLHEKLQNYHIILASKSPRRQELLKGLNIPFEIQTVDCEEKFPETLAQEKIPAYLAQLKSDAFRSHLLPENYLIITADTIVLLHDRVFGKPKNREEAIQMLRQLSGNQHTVITGVCITTAQQKKVFSVTSNVQFKELSLEEIEYYVDTFHPMDKAGAYGVQEWIGYIGISYIDGSYFNVMGLPVQRLYEELNQL